MPSGDRPLDVAAGAVDLARTGSASCVQLRELVIVEAQLLDELGRDLLLDRAAVGQAPDRDLLEPRPSRSSTSPERSMRKCRG